MAEVTSLQEHREKIVARYLTTPNGKARLASSIRPYVDQWLKKKRRHLRVVK